MTLSTTRLRLALAGLLATATLGAAAPAYAGQEERCERKLERLEQRFRQIEERRGYDAASRWWNDHGWPKYYERCVAPEAMAITTLDEQKLEAFVLHTATELGAALNAALVTLGDQLGLYKAMADGQPLTAAVLAARTGTQERYVREWLNAQAASGFVEYDAAAETFTLPPEHAAVLASDDSPVSMTGAFQSANAAVAVREQLAERFVNGHGVGWHEHHHDLWHGTARAFAKSYRTYLVQEWLPALDGVVEKLETGARVADVGCGHGSSTIVMAEAFPASRFRGIDYHADSIAAARRDAEAAGVDDRATFEVAGATELGGEGYDLVAFFDSFHDLGDPLAAARHAANRSPPTAR